MLLVVGSALLAYAVATARPVRAASSVYVDGLLNPRGLAFDARGTLYVAEAGIGGATRVAAPNNETFRVGTSGRVSRVPRAGVRETLDDGLPSVYSERHQDYLGPTAVAMIGDDVFVLTASGWSAAPGLENWIIRYRPDGSKESIADYGRLAVEHPPLARRTDPRADVPSGVPYGMVALDGKLYTTDGNLEFVQEFGPDGRPLRRLLEYPYSIKVLTGITVGPDRALYVVEMGIWPYPEGGGRVTRLTRDGETSAAATGVTAPLGVAFGRDGALYVVEHSAPLRQARNTGRLVRAWPDGGVEVVLDGLNLPTAVATGPDGNLYVSNNGNRGRSATGQVLRVEVAEWAPLRRLAERAQSLGAPGAAGLATLVLGAVLAIRGRIR